MSVREPSTDPLKEHDISDVINRNDNGPETMAVIEKYNVLRAALVKLREKLVGAKNDAAETRTALAGNMSALHRKLLEEHLCGLDNEISELEAKVNNTTKAAIQLAMDVRATAEDENGARLLALLDRQRKNKAARNTADDDSIVASVSSNQSTFTLRSGKDNITVKAGSIPNGKDEDSLRYDGKPTPSKAENVPKGDGAGRPKTPPMPSPPSDDDSPFSDDNENTPPVRSPAATGNPTGANPTAGTGGLPQSSTPRVVGDLGLTGLGLGPTNEQASGANRNVPPAARANDAAAGAGGFELSGYTAGYPNIVGGGSALAVPEDETLTQTEGDFSVEDPLVARSNTAKSRIKLLLLDTDFRSMSKPSFKNFVEKHHDDFIVKQTVGFGKAAANKNCSDILFMLKDTNISICKTVMENHHLICPELKTILVHTAGPHRPVPIIFAGSRSALGKPIRPSSSVLELYSTHRNNGIRGKDIPVLLGSPQLRLEGILGILTPGFCSMSIDPEEAAGILQNELKRQNKYTNTQV